MSVALFHELESRIRDLTPPSPAGQEAAPAPRARSHEDDDLARLTAEARERAAVVGWFRPKSLIEEGGRPLRERVLSGLVPDCDCRTAKYGHEWCLRREPRRVFLAQLAADQARLKRALRSTQRFAADGDSQLLRRILRGERLKLSMTDTAPRESHSALLRVAEWTDGLFPNAPKPADVQGLLARDAIWQSLSVLGEKFHGRREELEKLERFLLHRRSKRTGEMNRLPVLALSGVGGVGKSALLSRFTRSLLTRPRAARPLVVLIDFDRARFSAGDPVALTFELTRQVGAWCPQLATELRELRHSARTNLLSSGFASQTYAATSALEAVARSGDELKYRLPRVLAQAGIGTKRRLVIVLDTFEVLQGATAEATHDDVGVRGVHAVAEWINDLFFTSGLSRMNVVVAGRAPITEDPVFGALLTEPELRLAGIERSAALAMLREQGLSGHDARLVTDALADPKDDSCNPLMFRLAARLVKSGAVRAESLQRDVVKGRRAIDQALVQGVLYRRILAHIGEGEKDATLATLAHPGLVLRRVTPDVIKRILVPILLPRNRRSVDPVALFERLRREVWLVRETGPQTVEHRSDLRRTMLRLIDADLRHQAVRIHRAAIRYYRAGADPGMDPEAAAGEALYHTLMLTTRARAAKLDPVQVRRHEATLLPSLEDLPAHVLAVVKSILDRPLTDAEGLALPEPQRTQFILRQGERCVHNDEPYRALDLLAGTDLHPYWELEALAATVAWQEAKARGFLAPVVETTSTSTDGESYERANLATWVALCLGESEAALAIAEHVLTSLDTRTDWTTVGVRLLEQLVRRINYRTAAARDAGRSQAP
jgi:hypothetical protein